MPPVPTVADVERGKANLDAFDLVINEDENTSVTTPGGRSVDSLARAIASLKAFNFRGAWATGTAYAIKDLVYDPVSPSGPIYVRTNAGTSPSGSPTPIFLDEYDSGNGPWAIFQGVKNFVTAVRMGGSPLVGTDLYSSVGAYSGQPMTALGYYDAGDRGGGDFYWDADSTATDNGGTIIKPTAVAGAGRWMRIYSGVMVDKWFGVKADGASDDLAALASAVAAARSNKTGVFLQPATNYRLVTASIVLASDTLDPVPLFGVDAWFDHPGVSEIRGNFDGPIVNVSGIVGDYSLAPLVERVKLTNPNAGASACGVLADYSGGLRLRNVNIVANNVGVKGVEIISPEFSEVTIQPSSGKMVSCYDVFTRNPKFVGGRAYGANYAINGGGDCLLVSGLNSEFCDVFFRQKALTSAAFVACHIENTECVLTNAETVPIGAGAWVDNASDGIGISGEIAFINCHFVTVATNTNLAVIKSQVSFNYSLRFSGCLVNGTNKIVGNSFAPGTQVALPSATKLLLENQQYLTIVPPPKDVFSSYVVIGQGDNGNPDIIADHVQANGKEILVQSAQTQSAAVINGAYLEIDTGASQFGARVWLVSFYSTSAGKAFVGKFDAYFPFDSGGAVASAIAGAGVGGDVAGNYAVTFAANAKIRITNNSGITKDIKATVTKILEVTL